MLYIPELALAPASNGDYSLLAVTPVQSAAFVAVDPIRGAPASIKLPEGTIAWQLPLRFDGATSPAASDNTTVRHRIPDLRLQPGAVIVAYVMYHDAILGEAGIVLASAPTEHGELEVMRHSAIPTFSVTATAKVQVSAQECLKIVVISTPAGSASSAAQQLHELGVVDANQTRKHQHKVSAQMSLRGSSIDPDNVTSGPSVTVAASAQSAFLNQGS